MGEDCAVFQNAGIEEGINPNQNDRTKAPLVIIATDEIASMQQMVRDAGATITKSLLEYPGGSRFHFLDPSGNDWLSSSEIRQRLPNAQREHRSVTINAVLVNLSM